MRSDTSEDEDGKDEHQLHGHQNIDHIVVSVVFCDIHDAEVRLLAQSSPTQYNLFLGKSKATEPDRLAVYSTHLH